MAPFYGWGSTASRLEPLRGGSLLFTTKFPEIPGTHFINLGRMKGWVDLGAIQWFWTQDPWIGNPAPWPLGYCSIKHEKLVPDPFLKYYNWAYLWLNSLKFYTVCFYYMLSWGLSKYIENKLQTTCVYLILGFFKK